MSWQDEDAADIHAAFAEEKPVRYTGAGLDNAPVTAIRHDVPAESFQGPGSTLRKVTFEVRQSALPQHPRKGNRIVEQDGAGAAWRVNDITRRDDIGAWELIVEVSE